MNVSDTGAKAIKKNYNASIATLSSAGELRANETYLFTYDGTYWTLITSDYNSTYYYTSIYCTTAAATAAKVGTISGAHELTAGKYFQVWIQYTNTAKSALTLNISGQGAKPIYINGQPSSASNYVLSRGAYIVYYDGTNYYFRTDDKLTANITGDAGTVNGHTVLSDVPAGAKFTDENTTYTFTGGTNKFTVTGSDGSNNDITVTPSIANNITGAGTADKLAKFTGTNTIGNIDLGTGLSLTSNTLAVDLSSISEYTPKEWEYSFFTDIDYNYGQTLPIVKLYYTTQAQIDEGAEPNLITQFGSTGPLTLDYDEDANMIMFNSNITVTSTSVSDGTNTFNKYVHPTSAGNKHIPSGGSTGQYLKYSSSGTAAWATIAASDISGIDGYKTVQTAVTSPTVPTSGTTTATSFIDTISQNTNGVITATKKSLPTASTSVAGIIKIGTSVTTAAAGNHTHTISLSEDTGTSAITLALAGKYKLTAGGNSVIFTMPTVQASSTPIADTIAKYDNNAYLNSTTPSANDNSTKVATTAYVDTAIPLIVNIDSDINTGTFSCDKTYTEVLTALDNNRSIIAISPMQQKTQDISESGPDSIGIQFTTITSDGWVTIELYQLDTNNTVTKSYYSFKANQDISGKADKSATVSTVTWDSTNKKLTKTINGSTTDVVTAATLKTDLGLSSAMLFMGSLGTGGTITSLPAAAAANRGYTYKVITDGTYASTIAKVGDVFVSNGSEWVLIPSGDEPKGTVTSITIKGTSPISVSNSTAITTDGTRTISLANAYGDTQNPYGTKTANYVLAGPASGSAAAPSFRALVAADIPNLAWSKITSGTPTTLAGYGITDAKIANGVITLGSNTITPLTAHQDISGKADKSATVSTLTWDTTNKKITKTINGTASDVVQFVAGDNVTLTAATGKLTIASTDTHVTAVGNHYTPSDGDAMTTTNGTAANYALNTEYTVLTGVTLTTDAAGHVTGISTTRQKIKDTNTTYTLADLGGVSSVSASGTAPLTLTATPSDTTVSITGSISNATTTTKGVMKVGTGLSVSSGTVSVKYGKAAGTALQGNVNILILNDSYKGADEAMFYAPTTTGTSGQYLKSSGSGAPTWATFSASTVGLGNVTNHAQVTAIGWDSTNKAITQTVSGSTTTTKVTQANLQSAIFVISDTTPSDTSVIWLKPVTSGA